jgi:hypothetical protein
MIIDGQAPIHTLMNLDTSMNVAGAMAIRMDLDTLKAEPDSVIGTDRSVIFKAEERLSINRRRNETQEWVARRRRRCGRVRRSGDCSVAGIEQSRYWLVSSSGSSPAVIH